MADTTYYDLPYPASTGKVSEGWQNMQDLAEQIDTILHDADLPIVGDGANVLRTDTTFGGVLDGTYDALTLDDNAVTTAKILNDAVTTAKILAANVTGAKIESSVALAGAPTTTTAATADDSTKIATTEFVQNVAQDFVIGTLPNDSITNAKINSAAAISYSKLNLAASITSADLVNGTIVNEDVSASAAIVYSKLNLASSITSGDIVDGTIVNGDINASAAIDKTKISGTAITAADTGTVTSTIIADGTIVNGDISASAGIVDTKLATISTALKVSNSATTATDANTASAIVARDASGNFTAGTITATNLNLSGYINRGAPVTKTASFTLAATENWLIVNATASCVVTLGAATAGREVHFKNLAAFTIVSASSNVKPIGTNTAGTAILPATAGTFCTLVGDGTDWVIMQSGPGLFS